MDRLIATGSVNLAGADAAPLSGTPQYATNGNPGVTAPTQFPAYQYNALQEEIVQAILGAGISLDRTTNAQLLAAIRTLGASVVGNMRNLAGSAAGGTKTASFTLDEIVAETALGGICFKGKSLSLSFNGAGTGANGMDTGAIPTSGDLHIYAIFNPASVTWATLGTSAGSGSLVYGGVNPVAGFTASTLIGSYKTDGTPNIIQFVQVDRRILVQPINVLTGGSSTSFVSVSLSGVVPINGKSAMGTLINNTAGSSMGVAADNAGNGSGFIQGGSGSNYFHLVLKTAQTLFYKVGANNGNVIISGYDI